MKTSIKSKTISAGRILGVIEQAAGELKVILLKLKFSLNQDVPG